MRLRRSRFIRGMFSLAALASIPALVACSAPAMIASGGATAGVAMAEERGPQGAIDDNAIAGAINQRWLNYDWHIFRDVSTSVSEGRVMLTGKVEKPEDQLAAVRLTWTVKDVREVFDDIKVTGQGDVMDYARDSWISAQLRTNMTFDDKIRAINYNIVTVDGVVHLLGIAQDQDEIERITEYARNVRYVRGVVSHVLLKDDPRRHAEALRP